MAPLAAIARAYRDPRGTMSARLAAGISEPRALAELMAASGLLFLASLPTALATARGLAVEDAVPVAVSAHLFGYLLLLPLAAYAAAALLHLGARAFGGRGGWLGARAALFRSTLMAAPVAVALALAAPASRLPSASWLGYAGLAFWLWLLAASLAAAEGFAATGRVAAVLGVGLAGILSAASLLAGGAAD